MENNKKLISLKEAAELTGYSSDYIGQLIRSGKIFGEQVYSNVVWKTTEEDVLAYKNKSKNTTDQKSSFFAEKKRQFSIQIKILKILFENFRTLILVLFFAFFILFGVIFFIFNSILNNRQGSILDINSNSDTFIQY